MTGNDRVSSHLLDDIDVSVHINDCAERGDTCIDVNVSPMVSEPGLRTLIDDIINSYNVENNLSKLEKIRLNVFKRGTEGERTDRNHPDFSFSTQRVPKNIQIEIKYTFISAQKRPNVSPETPEDMETDSQLSSLRMG